MVLNSLDQFWLFIDDLEYRKGQLKHIFHKGDDKVIAQDTEIFSTSTAPALYLHQNKNAFIIYMNTFGTMNEKVVVNDVPLNKWINVGIRVEGSTMDVSTLMVKSFLDTSSPMFQNKIMEILMLTPTEVTPDL